MAQLIRLIFKPILFVFHSLPNFIKDSVARLIGFLWFDLLRIRRKTAIENVKKAYPKLSDSEATAMARKSLYHMGKTVTEFFSLPFLKRDDFDEIFEFQGLEKVEKALSENKCVFLWSAHIGNGDLGVSALSQKCLKIHLISKIFKTKWMNDLWFSSRRKHGTKFIAPKKSSYEILKALKAKEIVIFVLDQYTGPPNGIEAQFFGHPAGTAFGPALFAQRSKSPVLLIYTYRSGPKKHVITCSDPIPFEEKENKDKTLLHMTQVYNDKIEEAVRAHPEQWMWIHRRWKRGF